MTQNREGDEGATSSPAPSKLGLVLPFPGGLDRSVGPRLASRNAGTSQNKGLDARAALQTISRERTFTIEARVFAYLAALSVSYGEAWPRLTAIALAVDASPRLVLRAVQKLEASGRVTTRRLEHGELLPNGSRVFMRPMRVFRTRLEIETTRSSTPKSKVIDRSPSKVIDRSCSNVIDRSPSSLRDLDQGELIDLERRESSRSADGRASGDAAPAGAPPPRPLTHPHPRDKSEIGKGRAGADGAGFFYARAADDDDELAGAPASSAHAIAPRTSDVFALRGEETRANERGRAASSTDPGDRELGDVRTVIAAWCALVGEPRRFTRARREIVARLLADGFSRDELLVAIEHAANTPFFSANAGRQELAFMLGTPDRVAALLRDAAAAARNRGKASRSPSTSTPRRTPPPENASRDNSFSSADPADCEPTYTPDTVRALGQSALEALRRGELPKVIP